MYFQLCESIVRYSYYLAKEYHKENIYLNNVNCFVCLLFVCFSIQTVVASCYYGIKAPLPHIWLIKNTRPFLIA